MLVVPLQAVPNQTMQCQLGGQACTLTVRQTQYAMFMDVDVAGEPMATGVICEDRNRIVRFGYLGFLGDFVFVDTQGIDDPIYTGLGDRWQLVYLTAAEIAAAA
jgi:hypothetical protein